MTSATDELRRMLDERGVEYFKHEDGEPLRKLEKADEPATSWHMGGASVCAVPIKGSNLFDLWIDHITPAQAIAATLSSCNCSNNCTNSGWVSRTDLDAATLARSLRRMAGDGSIEWVMEPIQASVLLDIADMLTENAKLRELVRDYERCTVHADCARCEYDGKMSTHCPFSPCFPDIDELRELGVEVDDGTE